MNKIEFKKFIDSTMREEIEEYFFSHSDLEFREHFNLSHANTRELKKLYNLHYSKEQISQKRKATWVSKETSLKNKQENLKLKISKENLVEYYITNNNTFNDTCLFFNISTADLIFLLKEYDCKKPKQLSAVKSKETKLKIYGDANFNNRSKAEQTCLDRYNVKNPFQSAELMKDVYTIKESKYGKGNANNWHKNHQTRIEHFGSLEESYRHAQEVFKQTCLERYGVTNVSNNDEIKIKIQEATKQAFLDKYGVECYWQTSDAKKSLNSKDSKPNLEFKKLLEDNNFLIDDKLNREFSLKNKIFDFKLNDNTLIEVNPTATHNSTWGIYGKPLDKNYHYNKTQLAVNNGYRCINIWDWDDKDKIINLLLPKPKIYGRNCTVKEVPKSEAVEFINKYHLQNYSKSDIRIGLYYNDKLVSIMTFGKPRYNKNYEYELIRYCSSHKVIGGSEKLFKYFVKNYNPKSIISYCDWSKFTGDVYIKLGFTFKSYAVSKHWYNMTTKQHITDNLLRQRGFDQLFNTNYGKGYSNTELMLQHNFVEIYDAGQATYVWINEG